MVFRSGFRELNSILDRKYDAIVKSGIPIVKRYDIPRKYTIQLTILNPLLVALNS